MIKVLVIKNTTDVVDFLLSILNSDSTIRVTGVANNGQDVIEAVKQYKPDVIAISIDMHKMDGLETTRKIMETIPTPIIVFINDFWNINDSTITLSAMEAGALMVLPQPTRVKEIEFEATATNLLQAIKAMAEVKVVRRWPKTQQKALQSLPRFIQKESSYYNKLSATPQIVAIGVSTGGPIILQTILSNIPVDFPIPILIVQHMAVGFIRGFVEWLNQISNLPVQLAVNGERLIAGQVYIAPDNNQIKIGIGGQIILTKDLSEIGHCPSISNCFSSIAETYGKHAIGILLSGMGKDGAAELKLMRDNGAITIAQDEESSVVFGMPAEAIRLGAAQYILNPEKISLLLKDLLCNKNK